VLRSGVGRGRRAAKNAGEISRGVQVLFCSTRWIREEQLSEDQVAAFFLSITFPQRDQLTRFMTTVS
jgi:hypothetical protein